MGMNGPQDSKEEGSKMISKSINRKDQIHLHEKNFGEAQEYVEISQKCKGTKIS